MHFEMYLCVSNIIMITVIKVTGGSRTATTTKLERLVIIVNGFQPSILDVAAVLDLPLNLSWVFVQLVSILWKGISLTSQLAKVIETGCFNFLFIGGSILIDNSWEPTLIGFSSTNSCSPLLKNKSRSLHFWKPLLVMWFLRFLT